MDQNSTDGLTREEQLWLLEHNGKIRLGHDPNARPIDFIDKDGQFNGLAADYVHLIEKKLNFKFDIVRAGTWDEVVQRAKNNEIDVLCTFTKNQDREQWMLFTQPYIIIPTVILTRDDIKGNLTLETMKDMKITFTKGWIVDDYLRQNYSWLDMLPAKDPDEALNNLVAKKADAWVTALTVASNKIEENKVSNIRVAGNTELTFKLSMASRKDLPILNRILEKGLAQISEKERSAIFAKWIHINQENIFKSRTFWIITIFIVCITILPGMVIASWNKILKRKVIEKTRELEIELMERNRSQAALRISEDRYRSLVESQTDLVIRFKPDGRFVYVNNSFCAFSGKTKKELIGTRWQASLMEEDIQHIEKKLKEITPPNSTIIIEHQVRSGSGETPWMHFANTGLFDDHGNLMEIQSVGRDISERKKLELALRESNERLNLASRAAHLGIWDWDIKNNKLTWDVEMYQLYGIKKEEFPDAYETWLHILHPEDREMNDRISEEARRGEREYNTEFRILRPDGAIRYIKALGQVIWDSSAQPERMIGINYDITERKQAEVKLRESEDKYRLLFNSANDSVFVHQPDADGTPLKFIEVNDMACKVYGYTREELLELTPEALMPPGQYQTAPERIKKIISKGQGVFEIVHQTNQGKLFPVEISAFLFEFQGKPTILSIVRDITDRKKAEEDLRQAQKLESIGILAGGIAHDFNNILFPLIGFAEMLQEDLPKNSSEQESISQILLAAMRAKELVNQILTFSRQTHKEFKPVRIQAILKEVFKLVKSLIPSTIDIQTDIDQDCGMVIADPAQIHQVIMNLVINAYHAMQESGGQLKVSLQKTEIESGVFGISALPSGHYVLLKIIDTGTGIKKEIMGKIFDPYFTTKETGKGTGLGLSVVQGIVKKCMGDIQVYSDPGKGTEVHVYLPVINRLEEIERPGLSGQIEGGAERILLVDDEEMIVKMEKQMLERMGYHVTARTGSVEAFEAFKATPDKYDLIISDMTMPNLTGIKLANKMKAVRTDIPVIICTGYSDQIDEKTIKKLGIQGFVMKPVIRREIAETIRKVLKENKADKKKSPDLSAKFH